MPAMTLMPTCAAESNASPARIIWKDSHAKVLKVVKPPQKPVTSSNFMSSDNMPRPTMPVSSPMSNEPMTFTAKVPHGKSPENHL